MGRRGIKPPPPPSSLFSFFLAPFSPAHDVQAGQGMDVRVRSFVLLTDLYSGREAGSGAETMLSILCFRDGGWPIRNRKNSSMQK